MIMKKQNRPTPVRGIDDNKVRLGYHKKQGTEFIVNVSASSRILVGPGKFELIEVALKAICSNPAIDLEADHW